MARKRYFGDRTADLPWVLAGPILRQVTTTSVTVWVALKEPAKVRLQVFQTEDGKGNIIASIAMVGEGQTVRIGTSLHLVAVTATGDAPLQPATIYAYDLQLYGNEKTLSSLTNLSIPAEEETGLSYFSHGLPTFATPPQDLNHLKLVHGSCRKPHGGGQDLLPVVDQLLGASASDPSQRVQQLYFTGDQIYGDDVADALLWVATDVGDMLLGWTEHLPIKRDKHETDQVYESYALKPGVRSDIAKQKAGLTATIGQGSERASSHFFSLGEYLAAYLLVWSPTLWPQTFISGSDVLTEGVSAKQWDQDVQTLKTFIQTLPQVRRVLANISTYMICDDHDISDDWYLNRNWCERVLGKPLGYRVVFNGLLAYAFCQAWGNTPEQFLPGESGAKLCEAVEKWSQSQGQDQTQEEAIARYLGLPSLDQEGQPCFQRDGNVDILKRHPAALKWHYHVQSYCHEVLVLDTRTWRGYPDGKAIAPPMLLCPSAFEQQLEQVLVHGERSSPTPLTFVVLPTNLISLSLVDQIQEWDWCRDRVFSHDVGDSWNFHKEAFTRLILTLSHHRKRLVILSGDIHYSCAVQLQVWPKVCPPSWAGNLAQAITSSHDVSCNPESSVIIQLTSSAIKNAELATHIIHTKLKALHPEPSEDWLGWRTPPICYETIYSAGRVSQQQLEVPSHEVFWHPTQHFLQAQGNDYVAWQTYLPPSSNPPDWRYKLRWHPRQAATPTPMRLKQTSKMTLGWRSRLTNVWTWLWRNRWVQEGTEVIGHNNISVVSCRYADKSQQMDVIQESYWLAPWQPGQVVSSKFCISLPKTVKRQSAP